MGQDRYLNVQGDNVQGTKDELPIALGVIRSVEAETYNEAVNKQIAAVREKAKAQTFDELTTTLDTFLL